MAVLKTWATSSINPETIKELDSDLTHVWRIEEFLDEVMRDCLYSDPFHKLMYFHFKVSLPDDILVKVDRMSMAYSLEAHADSGSSPSRVHGNSP